MMDKFLFDLIHNLSGKSIYLDYVFIFIANYLILIFPIIVFLFLIFSQDKKKRRDIFLLSFSGTIFIYLFNFLLQKIYFRERPFVVLNFSSLINISPLEASFPSTHTALAFIFAFVIFNIDKRLGVISFLFALLIGLSRIFVGVHWPSDVFGGIILSLFTFLIVKGLIKICRI